MKEIRNTLLSMSDPLQIADKITEGTVSKDIIHPDGIRPAFIALMSNMAKMCNKAYKFANEILSNNDFMTKDQFNKAVSLLKGCKLDSEIQKLFTQQLSRRTEGAEEYHNASKYLIRFKFESGGMELPLAKKVASTVAKANVGKTYLTKMLDGTYMIFLMNAKFKNIKGQKSATEKLLKTAVKKHGAAIWETIQYAIKLPPALKVLDKDKSGYINAELQ